MGHSENWKLMLTSLFGIFVAIVSLLLVAWMFLKGGEKAQRFPWLRRGFFLGLVVVYAVWMTICIVQVVLGRSPAEELLGLPGGLLLIWFYVRASKTQTRP